MSQRKPKLNSKHPPDSLLTQSQLVDSLTSHISLYHAHPSLTPNPNPNPRSAILKWFSSLSVHNRQSQITTVDPKLARILVQMLHKLKSNGSGSFIILPDIPSRDLPTLCFKHVTGLLARVSESDSSANWIAACARLFSSAEGDIVNFDSNRVDSVTMSEEFVGDLDKFVEVMDRISGGEFLRGEVGVEIGEDWCELGWLKGKGYYSLGEFVANRVEVALRLAWLRSGNGRNGRRLGVKVREKVEAVGKGANVFWRKKGCVDWWDGLEFAVRRKVLVTALGKTAKYMIHDILKSANNFSEDETTVVTEGIEQPLSNSYPSTSDRTLSPLLADKRFGSAVKSDSLSGKANSVTKLVDALFVLQHICSMVLSCRTDGYDKGKLFFSTLHSFSTINDCILRKLRGFLMVISLDCTKLELLGEGTPKPSSDKSKEKHGSSSRKKKGRTRNAKNQELNSSSQADGFSSVKVPEEFCCQSCLKKEADIMQSNVCGIIQETDSHKETTKVQMEHAQDDVIQSTGKKRKQKRRSKNSSSRNPTKPCNPGKSVPGTSSSPILPDDKPMNGNPISDNITSKDVTKDKSTVTERLNVEDDAIQCIQGNVDDFTKTISSIDSEDGRAKTVAEKPRESSGALPQVPSDELVCRSCNEDTKHLTAVDTTDMIEALPDKPNRASEGKSEPVRIKESDTGSLSNTKPKGHMEYSSYEWPIYSLYFSSINSNLPAATDRLHLEVGHNWHYQSRRSFAPPVCQARKPLVEGGCNGILSQPVAMSLDCPPLIHSARGFVPPVTCNYDSGFISRRRSAYQQGFAAHNVQYNGLTAVEDERNYSSDLVDFPEASNTQDLVDECDSHWLSEEELEMQNVSGIDYNQYFGGGVMYWDPSDHPGNGYSRPPSLSSDDSSWAWREADMSRAVDEMVAFSSSYSTNGLTSPTASSFCSPFDTIGPGHQALGYVMPGNELSSNILNSSSTMTDTAVEEEVSGPSKPPNDIDMKAVDSFPYPILRPIIIPSIPRERSRSEFKRNYDHKSPRVPLARREQLQIKRPPSPVVLCVPRAPCPPPPSPVSDSRKHRGFPTVRSGSSSPRHWGMRGWYHEGNAIEDVCFRMDGPETVWPSWRKNKIPAHPIVQPVPGALLQDHLIAMSQLALDQEHPDVAFPLQPLDTDNCSTHKESIALLHSLLNDEIDYFCKQVAGENMARKPYINWAVKRVARSLQVLWPRSRTNIFGSNASGLSLPSSDVDLVVCLPPVRNLEPIKEAGILEGRNGIKETCLQHAARYLSNQEWVKSDSLKTVENTAIPIIMLVVEVPYDLISSYTSNVLSPKEDLNHVTGEGESHSCSDVIGVEDSVPMKCSEMKNNKIMNPKLVRLDISFKTSTHTGLQTTELVKELTDKYPAVTPLALILKKFLADRGLDQSYSGGLSSYCLVLLIIRFLQHEYHLSRPINQNFGSLLMDFLYFFGNVFDPRQIRISVQGSGVYIKRERGCSIDPLHIDDPLFSTNNVGRNCFRVHQCIKAFSEAYSVLKDELAHLSEDGKTCSEPSYRLLRKIIPSIDVFKDNKI